MRDSEWQLLTTLPDLPSAHSLAQVLQGAGIAARVMSDAGVLGQAAPSRIYVEAAQLQQAQQYCAPGPCSEEELAALAAADDNAGPR